MLKESIDTRLAEPGELLAEVDELGHVGEWILVLALLGGVRAEHIADERSVPNLLLGHELDQSTVVGSQASLLEGLDGVAAETLLEEIELDVLLVQG